MKHLCKPIAAWLPVVGRWSFSAESATYEGPEPGKFPYGICICDSEFDEGEVELKVELTDPIPDKPEDSSARVLFGYRSLSEPYLCLGIGGYKSAYVIADFQPPNDWRALSTTGSDRTLKPNSTYKLYASLLAQQATLRVNDIKALGHRLSRPVERGQIGLFSWGERVIRFHDVSVRPRLPQAFVVMQFSAPYISIYSEVIQSAAAGVGVNAYNAGEIIQDGMILDQIALAIRDSALVIAEITPPNQNVYYELGYAHAIGKPTILMAKEGTNLPFDLRSYRVLFYKDSEQGLQEAREKLTQYLAEIVISLRTGRVRLEEQS